MRHPWLVTIIALLVITVGFVLFVDRTQAPAVPMPVVSTPTTPVQPQQVTQAKKDDLIVLSSPLPGATINSPLTITGQARGNWYFEGSFPIMLVDWDGKIIAQGVAKAEGNWMTTDFVPFKGTITFTKPDVGVSNRGSLILKKDNPSGDPKKDDALEVEIRY